MKHINDVTTKSKGTFPKATTTISPSSESVAKSGDGKKWNSSALARQNVTANGGDPAGKSGPGGSYDKSTFAKADNKSWPTSGTSVDCGK